MAKNINNLDKSLKQNITPADIGAAAASHGTHLTIGTGSGNAAAGNHTHSNILNQDTRAVNTTPDSAPIGLSVHLKSNGTDSLSDGGSYHSSLFIKGWNDYSGGPYGNLAITANNNLWFRASSSGTAWNSWKKVSLDGHTHSNYATTTTTGSLSSLQTSAKGSLVAAINEVFQSGASVKQQLVDTLVANGASVSTSDSWNTLISYINENSSNGGLDIISATTLPATGKENQICVITNNPVDNILLTSSVNDMITDGINIYLGNSSSDDISMGSLVPVYANGITTNYYFNRIYQGNNRLASYWYMNDSWKQLTNEYIPVFEDGSIITTELITGLSMYGASVTDGEIVIDASANSSYYSVYSNNTINFTDISKIEIVLKMNYVYGASKLKMYVASTDNPNSSNVTTISNTSKTITSTNYTTWTINTSTWTGTHYFIIRKYNEYSGLRCYIQSIRFY